MGRRGALREIQRKTFSYSALLSHNVYKLYDVTDIPSWWSSKLRCCRVSAEELDRQDKEQEVTRPSMKLQDSHLSCLLLERTSINNCWILLRQKKDYLQKTEWLQLPSNLFSKNKTIPKIIPDSGVKKENIIRVYTLSKCADFMCLNVNLKWIYCNDVQTISTHTLQ